MKDTIAESRTPEVATLGGGCFWCLEAVYEKVKGVQKVVSGYAGGKVDNPSYQQVCTGSTGHAEVVQITFDPAVLSYHDLLRIFFSIHDPTTLNRQGDDVGTQYRSVIYYHSPEQKQTAEMMVQGLRDDSENPLAIVTDIAPLPRFFPAEDYHQGYFRQHPDQGYCQWVIVPKLAKFRKHFSALAAS